MAWVRLRVQIAESGQRCALQVPASPFFKMSKIIFSADLHGNKEFYKRLLKKAEDVNVDAVVTGVIYALKAKQRFKKIFLKNL